MRFLSFYIVDFSNRYLMIYFGALSFNYHELENECRDITETGSA